MKTKMAAEVADHLITQFCVFGSPRIMQSDNGKEFTARVINDLSLLRPGMVIIHGRPRHPESQGNVGLAIQMVWLFKWFGYSNGLAIQMTVF